MDGINYTLEVVAKSKLGSQSSELILFVTEKLGIHNRACGLIIVVFVAHGLSHMEGHLCDDAMNKHVE